MKTVLIVLGIVVLIVLLLVGGCFALLYWAHEEGESAQEEFFQAVLSGDPAQLRAKLHEDVQSDLDDPVCAAWMAAIREHLGAYQGLSSTGFSTNANTTNGVTTVESSGTVEFEKGEARSELRMVDGKIVRFHVNSDQLPDNWFTKLDDTTLYDERARAFLKVLLDGDVEEALAKMAPGLREKFTPEGLAQGLKGLQERLGPVSGFELEAEQFDAEKQTLALRYQLLAEREQVDARVVFGAEGLKMVLTAFKIPAE